MKKVMLMICASLIFSACGMIPGTAKKDEAAPVDGTKLKVGDMVVFKNSKTGFNEGKIEKEENGKFEIRYGDSIAKKDTADMYVLPAAGSKGEFKAGDIVVAYSSGTSWQGGEVKSVSADVVEVQSASGSKINAGLDKVFKPSPAATADIKQEIDSKAFEDAGKSKSPVLPDGWKPKKGDKVAAQWSFGSWHVAIIKNVNENNIDIDWQNGWSDGTVALDKVAPYPTAENKMPAEGNYVIVKPSSDSGSWEFAVVTSVTGTEAEVKLADGKTKKVKNTEFIGLS